jgi:hypothetical protein
MNSIENLDVETVASGIAALVGSRVFEPLHDNTEDQRIRGEFWALALATVRLAGGVVPCGVCRHSRADHYDSGCGAQYCCCGVPFGGDS